MAKAKNNPLAKKKDEISDNARKKNRFKPDFAVFLKGWGSIFISGIALIVAIYSNRIAKTSNQLSIQANSLANDANDIYKDELTLTHRPYVWVENFAFLDEKNRSISDPNQVMLIVINSPAKLIAESHRLFAKRGDEVINIETKKYDNRILYPSERAQYTFTIEQESAKKANELLEQGFDLFRESKINYRMLSKKNEYFYEASWKFEEKSSRWKLEKSPNAN